MKLLLKVIFCFIFLFCLCDLKGQIDFRPGYVITNNNDTLHGLIDYRGAARNAKSCDFKESETSVVKEFKPFDIKGYRFIDSKFYVSKTVITKDMEVKLFLEFLVNGIADLYYYFDGDVSHYFIEKADGQIFELTNDEIQYSENGRQYLRESKSYIGYLRYAFADCPQIFSMISNTDFDLKPLVNVTKKYHDYMCDGEKCIIYEKKIPSIKFRFLPFISMNASSIRFDDIAKFMKVYENISYDMAYCPSIGLKANISLPRANEKLSFVISGEYGKSYFYGSGAGANSAYFEEVNIHLTSLKGKAGLKYTYPKGNIRPTLMIGGNMLYHLNKEVKRIEDNVENTTVYISKYYDPILSDNALWGYNIDIGIDYYTSSKVLFFNLGYDKSSGTARNNIHPYSEIIQTIHIDAGIYF